MGASGERSNRSSSGETSQTAAIAARLGNITANGEIYDMNGLTAASRELPLGTRVQVKNLNNNRSVVLRINDRGPYIRGRDVDVSYAMAKQLGFIKRGVVKLDMETI